MTREIKFRIWDDHKEEWLCMWVGDTYPSMSCAPLTISQYTGLRDKNGKEIYEGDIVKIWPQYSNLKVADMRWLPTWADPDWKPEDPAFGANESEVIGNIYENPDLLAHTK